ncbi:MAG: hypothetical protein PHO83_15945, partial [Geobacteraceae bacterium]|nr:hypothetical protein [Geobacteraceae bacterium]
PGFEAIGFQFGNEFFCLGKEIKDLRGGLARYAALATAAFSFCAVAISATARRARPIKSAPVFSLGAKLNKSIRNRDSLIFTSILLGFFQQVLKTRKG